MKPNLKSQNATSVAQSEELTKYIKDHKLVVQYLVALIKDFSNHLPLSVYSAAAQAKDIECVERRFASEGLSFATQTLPKLSEGLFQYFETGLVNYPSFALDKRGVHPLFLRKLFALSCSQTEHKVTAIKLIYQISVMFSKLKGPYPHSVLRKQLTDFVETDKSIGNINLFEPETFAILQQARVEIMELFKNNNVIERAKPKPGPGATNTPVAKHLRYRPHVLYTQIDRVLDYTEFFSVNPLDTIHQTKSWVSLFNKKIDFPTSRQKFVHKKVGKARGICIEENDVMFMQQAFRYSLYDWIESHPLTKGRICFRSQRVNQMLALASSWTGQMATLDETEASNRILRDVVSWLYQDTDIHDILMALSTRVITFPKEFDEPPLRTAMYAPMGSALCFPIMASVHWALIRAILLLHGNNSASREEIFVYGDDIILPIRHVDAVLSHLPRFGIKLNVTKSFFRSGFRESCGVHAFNGVNITPVYVKHIPVSTSITFAMSCIACEQQFFEAGYKNVAFLFRTQLGKFFENLPTTSETSSLFGFKRKGNFFPWTQAVVREKRDAWGNPVYKFRVVSAVQKKDRPPTEYECYLRHVLTRDESREIAGTPKSFKTRWHYVTWPEACGISNQFDIRTPRYRADERKEQCYEYYPQVSEPQYQTIVPAACIYKACSECSRNTATEREVGCTQCNHNFIRLHVGFLSSTCPKSSWSTLLRNGVFLRREGFTA